ncbi:sigma-70 family RNA polymerase sigma factor [Ketobacter alkanivorans]|uniref:RNA polymerase subunit sigma-24 n=1 Tax=Ketobacter alkanivorans TaxID=1917421 RepID=A0A2K9LM97_9GAMM|nr:sigma-70 family RNA polymerase sigma factor [Ketobacter alkanivorans]AUM13489.1 hypothetical protein Kalk_14125 [Ketobacter alkanivorans]MCP5018129.1 sigma-70 family RNA polymerase sigma factor [Ketobacter sp.]
MTDHDHIAQLLSRCGLRDQQAFLALYDATSAKLYGLILRIVKRDTWAQDVLQEAYMKIWTASGSYEAAKANPMTWMTHVARNRALDWLRSREVSQSSRNVDIDEQLELSAHTDPLRDATTHCELVRLNDCMQLLNEQHRQSIRLMYLDGLTYEEVANRLSKPTGSVKSWVRRGLQRVRECLGL